MKTVLLLTLLLLAIPVAAQTRPVDLREENRLLREEIAQLKAIIVELRAQLPQAPRKAAKPIVLKIGESREGTEESLRADGWKWESERSANGTVSQMWKKRDGKSVMTKHVDFREGRLEEFRDYAEKQ